jgi:hypothetical protein
MSQDVFVGGNEGQGEVYFQAPDLVVPVENRLVGVFGVDVLQVEDVGDGDVSVIPELVLEKRSGHREHLDVVLAFFGVELALEFEDNAVALDDVERCVDVWVVDWESFGVVKVLESLLANHETVGVEADVVRSLFI